MKYSLVPFIPVVFFVLFSCGGNLSDSQREAIHESMRDGRIQRVTPAQLTSAALETGRSIMKQVDQDLYLRDIRRTDSIAVFNKVRIFAMRQETVVPGTKTADVWEAYVNAADPGSLQDNIQKIGADSILYTRPVTFERPDGSAVLSHAVAVMMAVKNVIIGMEE
ncbi:MAG: hypothetical protein ACO3FI_03360 [Cyclobacteriaceae bacterium]